jgi:hypothetical protein
VTLSLTSAFRAIGKLAAILMLLANGFVLCGCQACHHQTGIPPDGWEKDVVAVAVINPEDHELVTGILEEQCIISQAVGSVGYFVIVSRRDSFRAREILKHDQRLKNHWIRL